MSWCACLSTLVALAAAAPAGLDLDSVLDRQAGAMGPLDTLQTITLEMTMVEPEAEYELLARMRRPDRMRVDLRKLGVSVYTEGIGKAGPWRQRILQWSPQEPSEAGSTALISGLEWFVWGRSLRELRDRGHTVALNPGPTEPGEVALRVRLRNGQERDYFVDATSFRVARSRQRVALHPDMKGEVQEVRWHETRYEDYRPVGKFTLPFRLVVTELATGRVVQTITVRHLVLNAAMPDELFEAR